MTWFQKVKKILAVFLGCYSNLFENITLFWSRGTDCIVFLLLGEKHVRGLRSLSLEMDILVHFYEINKIYEMLLTG